MKKHLAIFSKDVVKQIFSGKKLVETRFSRHKIAPFGLVERGDIVYIKPSGEEIVGQFTVKKVIFFEGLDNEDWKLIKGHYRGLIAFVDLEAEEKYFKQKENSRFGTLIFIGQVERFITAPVKIEKRDLRGWVVLRERYK